jgi:hypothetical protein
MAINTEESGMSIHLLLCLLIKILNPGNTDFAICVALLLVPYSIVQ